MRSAPPPTLAPRPLVVQSDGSLLLETAAPGAEDARDDLLRFAELEKAPEHVHTYRLSPLSLWNAAASGHDAAWVAAALERHARFPLPEGVRALVHEQASRHGRLRLARDGASLLLVASDDALLGELAPHLAPFARGPRDARTLALEPAHRGPLKRALAALGWPVADDAGFSPGAPLEVALRDRTLAGEPLALRPYQLEAVRAFSSAGAGTIVLPCGAGKTLVGIGAIVAARARALVVTTGTVAARQWRSELLDKTTLAPEQIVELTSEASGARGRGASDALGPVTLTTYSLLAHRGGARRREAVAREDWGLVVFDEVHLLPEPVLELVAGLQGRRRLGLTATLGSASAVGESRERAVFALVGPRRYGVSWKALERAGWIAEALCTELRVPLAAGARRAYAAAGEREKPRLAAENAEKLPVLERLLERHAGEPLLVLGTYLDQLEQAGALANAPVVTGASPAREREQLFQEFRSGRLRRLVLSRVGNHAIDLPEAAVAIQLSGTFGSREEEAQRLGRILRPKSSGRTSRFYALVSPGTLEEEDAHRRQLFLTEQGYRYEVEDVPAGGGSP